jgi:hypothetical protein
MRQLIAVCSMQNIQFYGGAGIYSQCAFSSSRIIRHPIVYYVRKRAFRSAFPRRLPGARMSGRLRDRPMPAEYNVEVVARGEADLVVVVASRMFGVPGVELVGLIPLGLQTMIGFAAGVSSAAKEPDAARMLVKFFTAPTAAPLLKAMGIEPFVE